MGGILLMPSLPSPESISDIVYRVRSSTQILESGRDGERDVIAEGVTFHHRGQDMSDSVARPASPHTRTPLLAIGRRENAVLLICFLAALLGPWLPMGECQRVQPL